MIQTPRTARRGLAALFVLMAVSIALGGLLSPTDAHVIPPERLRPVTEAFRRQVFVLGLNPIPWELVRKDGGTIAHELETLAPAEGAAYRTAIEAAIAGFLAEPKAGEEGPGPAERRTAAREILRRSTQAVARALCLHLERARRALPDARAAGTALDEARQVWGSFEHEVKATDPRGFVELGRFWLEMTTALGSPGLSTIGAVPPDAATFAARAQSVHDYVNASFGEGFQLPEGAPLAAVPRRSPTFDPTARLPIRLPPGSEINKQIPRPRQILNMATRGVDESETALIAVGDMAFDSAFVFGDPARTLQITCNTCHNKSITNPKFFVPGLSVRPGGMDVSNGFFAPHANNGHFDPLDTPDLRGIRFTAPYGRNGRFASLREFARNVIVNEFNGKEPDPLLLDGMVAYMLEFDFLPNPHLEKDGRLAAGAPEAARRGETLFTRPFAQMGGRSCASCHVPSTHFLDRQSHAIGSVTGAEEDSRDRALDTPTLLGIKHTPPYFHDGSLPTLAAVTEWFDRTYALGLTEAERADLTAYVETVGDGKDAHEDTPNYLDAEVEEFSFFLSAYEFLRDREKPELIAITFETVASELRNHLWEIQDPAYRPVMEKLAELMDRARDAVRRGDRPATDAAVAAYRALYAENVDHLK